MALVMENATFCSCTKACMSECNYENCKDYTLNEDNNIWMNKFKSKCGKNCIKCELCNFTHIVWCAQWIKGYDSFCYECYKKITLHIYEWMMALAFARYDIVN